MRDVMTRLLQWWEADDSVAVGTVVRDLQVGAAAAGGRDARRPGR